MTVYIDSANLKFRRMKMCHMIADTLDELHAMAEAIGMRREWFQPKSFPHYDVCATRKKQALALGVVQLNSRELVYKMRELRQNDPHRMGR